MRAERVVLDANVLISAALVPNGVPYAVVEAVRSVNGVLLFSPETFNELRTRRLRPKFDRYIGREDRAAYLAGLQTVAKQIAIVGARLGCRDPNDDELLETAWAGKADCLVTGDKHLLVMSPFRRIPTLKPADFLAETGRP